LGGSHGVQPIDEVVTPGGGWGLFGKVADEMVDQVRLSRPTSQATSRDGVGGEGRRLRGSFQNASASHPDEHDILSVELVLADESGDGTSIATLDDDGFATEGPEVCSAGIQIGGEVVYAANVEEQAVDLFRLGDEGGANAARSLFVADDDTDGRFLEQFACDFL
jgi:hypothetical protein